MQENNDWMTDDERAIHDAQVDLQIERKKKDALRNALRVAWAALTRCECQDNHNALQYLRSQKNLWS